MVLVFVEAQIPCKQVAFLPYEVLQELAPKVNKFRVFYPELTLN